MYIQRTYQSYTYQNNTMAMRGMNTSDIIKDSSGNVYSKAPEKYKNNKYNTLDKSAIISYVDFKTGAAISVEHSEDYSEDNPIFKVKSKNLTSGEEVFLDINIQDVDPRNASQMEMSALAAYYGEQTGKSTIDMAIRHYDSNISAPDAKANWLEILKDFTATQYKWGANSYSNFKDICSTLDTHVKNLKW